ncbi:MAG: HAD family hydrolase, partial [Thermodesulfobacteriota bacterium]
IFFDIDDTLLDHTSAETQAAQQFYAHFRRRLPQCEPDFVALWQHVAEQYMAAFLAGAMSFPEQRRRRIRAVFPTAMADEEADRLFRVYLAYYEQSWRAFPDVLPCFDRLAAHTLGILSNGHTSQQAKKLEILGIVARFTVVVTSEAVGVAKPDPRIFTWACHAVAAHPTQCVYVGDRLESDARAAHQAGWIGVWLNRTGPEMGPPDVITIPDLGDLPRVMAKLGAESEC